MATDHRNRFLPDPYLNARRDAQRALADQLAREMSEGMKGVNYSPDDDTYDLAEGPADRTFRNRETSEYDEQVGRMNERRQRGEN